LFEEIIEQIEFEITQIDHLFDVYGELFQRALQESALSVIELAALASVVHSFYNGLESIFVNIAKRLDQNVPTGSQWHRDLLIQIGTPTASRGSVLTDTTITHLTNYLGFRHFYRHSYTFFVEESKLDQLVIPISSLWLQVKLELVTFVESLKNQGHP